MDFTKLREYVASLPEVGVPGCDLAVYQDHKEIFRFQAGVRDAEGKETMRGDESYWLYSATKVLTTCAAMRLIEEGKINLDDPVSEYLPAYGFGKLTVKDEHGVHMAQRIMTVRHLMSMQSGLNYDLMSPSILETIKKTENRATTRDIAEALAGEPLEFEPGTNFLYSLSHDVLAAVIEVASGMKFSEFLNQLIFTPLNIRGFTFKPDAEEMKKLCAAYVMDEEGRKLLPADSNNYHLAPDYESGGAGLMGTVDDYVRFVDTLACDGVSKDGYRLLSPEMLQLWNANQLGPRSRKTFDVWQRKGYSYALGVRTRVDLSVGGAGASGEFGWDGAAGAWTMIDCSHHLSAFFGMHVRNFGYSYDVIHPTIRGLIYEGLGLVS